MESYPKWVASISFKALVTSGGRGNSAPNKTMHKSARAFVEIVARHVKPKTVVEFGSRQVVWSTQLPNLRQLFPVSTYIGIDIEPGEGVDIVADVSLATFRPRQRYDVIIACDMLEHCANPFQAVQNARKIATPNGVMIVTVPFVHPIHHQPDYFRFTPQGVELLLRPFTNTATYYQGDVALPRSVYGVASPSLSLLRKLSTGIEKMLTTIPAKVSGERIYKWVGEKQYTRLRLSDPKRESALEGMFD